MQGPLIIRQSESGRSWTSKVFNTVISLDTYQFVLCIATPTAINLRADNPGTCDYVGISEWALLDLQSIQHCDYFGHLSIFGIKLLK